MRFPALLPTTSGIAWLAIAAAVALSFATALLGPPEYSQFGGHDAPFAIRTLTELHLAWEEVPGVPPGWLPEAYGGFGAPVLFFYPPFGFLLARAFASLGLAEVSAQLTAAILALRLAGMSFSYLWLRGFTTRPAALLGAASFALFPYNALFNPIVRFAFAEAVASGLLPLLLLAIAAPSLTPRRRAGAVALGFAAIGAAHVPTALMAMVCGGAYALGLGWRRAAQTVLGLALGLGLLAFHLVPALLLGPEISTAALVDEGHSWRGTMLFWGSMATRQVSLIWVLLYAFFGLAAAPVLLTWRAAPAGPARRAVLLGGLCSLAFLTPLSLPAWALLPPLDYVQFPWRFLLPASLFFAAQIALLAEAAERAGRTLAGNALGLGVVVLALVPSLFLGLIAVAKPEARVEFAGGPSRTEREFAKAFTPPEYLPRAAREAGWTPFVKVGRVPPGVRPEPSLAEGAAAIVGFGRKPGRMRITGQADGEAALLLPQFWFPGWVLAGENGTLSADPATGLLRLSLPPGPFDILVERRPLPMTQIAALASVLVLFGLLALVLPGRSGRRRTTGTVGRSAPAWR